jgi:dienelactone hydrolase
VRPAQALGAAIALSASAAVAVPVPPPVAVVVDGRLAVGPALLAIYLSRDWSRPLPTVRRLVIIVHGYRRNAADYARIVMKLDPSADTLVIAPQFLAAEDAAAHRLPAVVLRWRRGVWASGGPADGPAASSAFDALDALLARANDRTLLPDLSRIVLAGFSAGGQLVQRYAAVGRGLPPGAASRLRYVVGSPSSFAYFGDERPQPVVDCPAVNRWKYGFAGALPPYVAAAARQGVAALERRYATRSIVYLTGANDNDPNHRFLDKSCAAEAQGPTRLSRMAAFFAVMRQRDGVILRQRMRVIAGVAHNAQRIFGSACGRAALFDDAGCTGGIGEEEMK